MLNEGKRQQKTGFMVIVILVLTVIIRQITTPIFIIEISGMKTLPDFAKTKLREPRLLNPQNGKIAYAF